MPRLTQNVAKPKQLGLCVACSVACISSDCRNNSLASVRLGFPFSLANSPPASCRMSLAAAKESMFWFAEQPPCIRSDAICTISKAVQPEILGLAPAVMISACSPRARFCGMPSGLRPIRLPEISVRLPTRIRCELSRAPLPPSCNELFA